MDRLGFGGPSWDSSYDLYLSFSILWWIDLVLGAMLDDASAVTIYLFQYPLVDRLGFGGQLPRTRRNPLLCFSILW